MSETTAANDIPVAAITHNLDCSCRWLSSSSEETAATSRSPTSVSAASTNIVLPKSVRRLVETAPRCQAVSTGCAASTLSSALSPPSSASCPFDCLTQEGRRCPTTLSSHSCPIEQPRVGRSDHHPVNLSANNQDNGVANRAVGLLLSDSITPAAAPLPRSLWRTRLSLNTLALGRRRGPLAPCSVESPSNGSHSSAKLSKLPIERFGSWVFWFVPERPSLPLDCLVRDLAEAAEGQWFPPHVTLRGSRPPLPVTTMAAIAAEVASSHSPLLRARVDKVALGDYEFQMIIGGVEPADKLCHLNRLTACLSNEAARKFAAEEVVVVSEARNSQEGKNRRSPTEVPHQSGPVPLSKTHCHFTAGNHENCRKSRHKERDLGNSGNPLATAVNSLLPTIPPCDRPMRPYQPHMTLFNGEALRHDDARWPAIERVLSKYFVGLDIATLRTKGEASVSPPLEFDFEAIHLVWCPRYRVQEWRFFRQFPFRGV